MKNSIYLICLAALLAGVSASSALAAEGEPGWVLELEPMYLWLTDGEDSYKPGSEIVRVWNGASFGPTSTLRSFEDDFDDEQFTFRGEAQRRREDKWGYGAMGWWFDTDTSTFSAMPEGTIGIPRFAPAGSTAAGVDVPSMRYTMTPIGNGGMFFDSLFNEISFSAEAEFDLWKVDIHAMREIGEYKPERTWDFLFGIEFVEIDAERRETVRDVTPRIADPAVSDDITIIEANAELDYGLAIGPMFGLQYERRKDKHRFKGLVTQSFVFADEDSNSGITLTSQQTLTGGSVMTVSSAQIGMASEEDSHMLPITEAKLAYNYDFTEKASLGLGGFLSVWWDAPQTPTFDKSNGETLLFLGVFLSGQLRFD